MSNDQGIKIAMQHLHIHILPYACTYEDIFWKN